MPKKLDLTNNLEHYITDHSENLTAVQKEIIQHNINLGDQKRLQISISQAQFLQTLIKISNIKSILEIGSFTGFSALSMALVLPKDGSLISLDKNSEFSNKAKSFYKKANENKITQIIKPAIDYLIKKRCKKIILGCTELPIAIFAFKSFKNIKTSKIFLDPNLILAHAAMKKYKK